MKKILIAFLMVFAMAGVSRADTVDPVQKTKEVVNLLDPQQDWLFSLPAKESFYGQSAALYSFKVGDQKVASARLGYSEDKTFYFGPAADLNGLYNLYVPSGWKANLPAKGVGLLSKYARVGAFGGKTWDTSTHRGKWIYGVTVGLAVTGQM